MKKKKIIIILLIIFCSIFLIYLTIPSVKCFGTKLMYSRLIDLRAKNDKWAKEQIKCIGYVPSEILVKFDKNKIDLQSQKGESDVQNFINNNAKFLITALSNKIKLRLLFSSISKDDLENFDSSFFSISDYLKFANTIILKVPFNVEKEIINELINMDEVEKASINPITKI